MQRMFVYLVRTTKEAGLSVSANSQSGRLSLPAFRPKGNGILKCLADEFGYSSELICPEFTLCEEKKEMRAAMTHDRLGHILRIAVLLCGSTTFAGAQNYNLVDVGPQGYGVINNLGQVVADNFRPTLRSCTRGGVVTSLGSVFDSATPLINDLGQVVKCASLHCYLANPPYSSWTDLGSLGGDITYAYGINASLALVVRRFSAAKTPPKSSALAAEVTRLETSSGHPWKYLSPYDVRMFYENTIFHADDVSHDPIRRQTGARVPPMDYHEISLPHNHSRFIRQRRRNALD